MEEPNQSSTDHRGLKLQNIIQKLSEHCDIKNPEELETDDVNEEKDSKQGVPVIKRRKQDTSESTVNGASKQAQDSSKETHTEKQNNDLKQKCNITDSKQQEGDAGKASPALPPGRISARIRSLKSKKTIYKEEWVDPDQIRMSGQKIPVQSHKNNSHEETTKTKTVGRKRKRKKDESFQSMEDYVNDAPVIQVGNLVGLRQCRMCAVMFVEKEQLITHMKAVHHLDDKVNIKQDVASESSVQNEDKLTDEKPFKCSQCESSFRKSSGLKQHVTRQHTQNASQKLTQANQVPSKRSSSSNDRPYECQVCGKAFKRKHHLQEHSYIHSDDKPYKCDTCSKTFNQRICLTKHLPCREHEKQHRKPTSTKTLETSTDGHSTHEQQNHLPSKEYEKQHRKPSSTKTLETSTDHSTHEQQNHIPSKENEKQHRKPSSTKETSTDHSTHEPPLNKVSDKLCDSNEQSSTETRNGHDLANGVVSKTGHQCHVNGSDCDGKTQVSNEERLLENSASKDTQKHVQESITDCSKLNGSTVATVTRNDQTCSVEKPTTASQEQEGT